MATNVECPYCRGYNVVVGEKVSDPDHPHFASTFAVYECFCTDCERSWNEPDPYITDDTPRQVTGCYVCGSDVISPVPAMADGWYCHVCQETFSVA